MPYMGNFSPKKTKKNELNNKTDKKKKNIEIDGKLPMIKGPGEWSIDQPFSIGIGMGLFFSPWVHLSAMNKSAKNRKQKSGFKDKYIAMTKIKHLKKQGGHMK